MRNWIVLMLLVVLVGVAGCTVFSAADKAVVDHRAAELNAVADNANALPAPPAQAEWLGIVWILENERRAAVNLSNRAHWEKAKYPYPAKAPTTLPWVPADNAPAVKP